MNADDDDFAKVLVDLREGHFSKLAQVFTPAPATGPSSRVVEWYQHGCFDGYPEEAAEALTCACFLGDCETAAYLIWKGVDPSGGNLTGMNAVHWAANRGHVAALRLLLSHGVPLEVLNMYGGTVLGQTVWSALHEPRPGQREAIRELLQAGAERSAVSMPTGNADLDALLISPSTGVTMPPIQGHPAEIRELARYEVRPEALDECVAAIHEFVAYVRANEPGALRYEVWQDKAHPTRFVHLFIWRDEEANRIHGESAAVRKFAGILYPNCLAPVEFVEYSQVDAAVAS